MTAKHGDKLIPHIQRARQLRGWTQRRLAREIGYDEAKVSRVLRGKHRMTARMLAAVAAAFGWRIEHNVVIDGDRRIPV